VFCLKISIVVCIQKHTHREFVHLEEGGNDGCFCIQVYALHPQGARINLPHHQCPPSWGERANWPNLKFDFFILFFEK
jgi:hypothetical protein